MLRRLQRSGADGKEPKEPKPASNKNVVDEKLLNAVDNIVSSIPKEDKPTRIRVRGSLLSRLTGIEKETFEKATEASLDEMQSDKNVVNLLSEVAADAKKAKRLPNRFAAERNAQRGLLLLRKEIFYQAKQEGYSADEASKFAERAVNEVEEKLTTERERSYATVKEDRERGFLEESSRNEKEQKLFNYAFQMAEKILYRDETPSTALNKINPDVKLPKFFGSSEKLGVFDATKNLQDVSLEFWRNCDLRAAKIANQPMGPRNAFEEQIEWTQKAKQWPYPIDNEYLLGDEEKVSFIDHVFLERHLPTLGIPRDGPIGHFMELVCVGLSKNPYMTAAKKREHLQWFSSYFNAEKQQLVNKLHKQEMDSSTA
ncbi:unnamed protein product, partial [Mesorhabditis belari]|uniref:Small ribosomal subunit protein mS31 n=1 Tax=Mesorhabditis belari TaxID=2138241 RepID=A0AAF3FET8_9BILA